MGVKPPAGVTPTPSGSGLGGGHRKDGEEQMLGPDAGRYGRSGSLIPIRLTAIRPSVPITSR